MKRYLIFPLILLVLPAARLFAAEAVWIEGEEATEHDFRRHGWYDGVDKSLLSNREWLSHYSQEAEGRATRLCSRRRASRSSSEGSWPR